MVYKKIAACVLFCGATHNCLSMEYIGQAVGAVKNGYTTASEKMYPTFIFKIIHSKWKVADDRKKVTLLHKLDRGFLDGHLKEQELTPLLDSIEDTVPTYPISQKTLGLVHDHLATRLPSLEVGSNTLFRAIKAMYLLSPDRLATDITTRKLLNNVADRTQRETIVSNTAQSIIKAGNADLANLLVSALEKQAIEVPFGTTAQVDLHKFLGTTATDSYRSCTYINGLGNATEDVALKQQAASAQARAQQLAQHLKDAQAVQEQEEKVLIEQFQAVVQKNSQLKANLAKEIALKEQLEAQYIATQEAKAAALELIAEEKAKRPHNNNEDDTL